MIKLRIHKFNDTEDTYIQIYLTQDEYEDQKFINKVNELKNDKSKIAYFICGQKNYPEILKEIIFFEVEKNEVS